MSNYDVHLLSDDFRYPEFECVEDDWLRSDKIAYEKGTVFLSSCSGAEYDLQIQKNNEPIGTISTADDEAFFIKTMIILEYLRGNLDEQL